MESALASAIAARLGSAVRAHAALGGGDINAAYRVDLDDGRRVFVKSHPRAPATMFPAEARGLDWLREANALRVPEVIAFTGEGEEGPRFLALEHLEAAAPGPAFDERLGRGLAELHRAGAPSFGFERDNFVGSLPQRNAARPTWADFYREERLRPLLRRAVERGLVRGALHSDFERLFELLSALVGPPEAPARLHGDLWGGNLHSDDRGAPCLIDPAVYGGHREIDLAMMQLFGGFGARVFHAYHEAYPLAPGYEERVPLYQLYPLLVHVNLFGGGYVSEAAQALKRALAAR